MIRVLITGGLGFIGHHLSIELKKNGFDVLILDNYSHNITKGWHEKIVAERIQLVNDANISVIEGDTVNFEQLESILKSENPQKIVHLAAIPSAIWSNENPSASFDQNLLATKNLLEIVRKNSLPIDQFTYFSSSMVYGNFLTPSVDEDSPKEPLGMYGTAKLCSELFIKTYHRLEGIPYTIIRPSALYGPRCINNRITQKFVENAILGKKIVIHGDGSQKLDFTFIEDLIAGTVITQVKDEAKNQTFNITTGHAEPLSRLTDVLKEYFSELNIQYTEWDKSRPVRGTLKINKIKKLGYSPKYRIDKGYRKYLKWYLDNKILE